MCKINPLVGLYQGPDNGICVSSYTFSLLRAIVRNVLFHLCVWPVFTDMGQCEMNESFSVLIKVYVIGLFEQQITDIRGSIHIFLQCFGEENMYFFFNIIFFLGIYYLHVFLIPILFLINEPLFYNFQRYINGLYIHLQKHYI